jgi:uncharacterized membrane protein
MKAICLASAMTVVLLVLVTLCFRLYPSAHRARQMLLLYLFCLAVLVALWFATPDDLGFIGRSLLAQPAWLDFAATLFFFSAGFFGGVLQLYNLCDRGFSLRILIDMLEAPTSAVDADYLTANYSSGRGLGWMYRKRIDDIIAARFVDQVNKRITLTAKGEVFADVFMIARRVLGLEPPQ